MNQAWERKFTQGQKQGDGHSNCGGLGVQQLVQVLFIHSVSHCAHQETMSTHPTIPGSPDIPGLDKRTLEPMDSGVTWQP
jgi:hypothetical protein